LQSELEKIGAEMEEMKEEHSGEGGDLESAVNEKGNITKGDLKNRIKEIKNDTEFADELALLEKYNGLLEKEAECKAKIKTAENELEKKVIAKYPTLSIDEIKTLVVDRKWMDELQVRIMSEVEHTSQTLAGRTKELAERYSETLPEILGKLSVISKKASEHISLAEDLLTGKKRLPGFSGEWVRKRIGEIGEITGSGVDKKINPEEIPVRLVNFLNVYHQNFIYSKDLNHFVTARPDQIARCSVKKGDVFFTPSSEMPYDVGLSAVAMEDMPDVVYSYHVDRLRLFEDWDLLFRAYIFQTKDFSDQTATQCEGSGKRYVLNLTTFRERLTVYYPKDKKEQTAIATVLSDMDAEIEALEKSLAKYQNIKTGMMQQLLNGKIRLVKN
jgi:hypothetical protein